MVDAVPTWKFWHPLPLWQAIVLLLVLQLIAMIPIVAVRELLGLPVPQWVSGVAAFIMFLAVRAIVQRRRAGEK